MLHRVCLFSSSGDKSQRINKSRWLEVALVALGSSVLNSERLEDKYVNIKQKIVLKCVKYSGEV